MYVCTQIGAPFRAPIANRRANRRAVWCRCVPKFNMHILRMYVYIDAPIILGVLYMYECMHVCMYYVCMRLCTPIGAPLGAPIANRRADRRPVCCRCVCPKLNMHILRMYVYIDAPIILGVLYMYECMHIRKYYVYMYVCTPIGAPFRAPIANRRADRRAVWCR